MLMNLKEILKVAKENGFAVPAFNVSSSMLLRGIIEACQEANSPVIIAIHPDELSFVLPSFTKSVIELAHSVKIPVCLHLDHGSSYEQVMEAIRCGFTSVMIDASKYTFDENAAICKKIVDAAHPVGVSVEGELGTIGMVDAQAEQSANEIIYTNPDDAASFIEKTGIDALAIAIGTSHGIYPKDKKPQLRLDILEEIIKRVNTPLVLHGGSANPDEEIAQSVKLGISKINISSDTKDAFYKKCREVLQDTVAREPNAIYPPCIDAMKVVAHQKIRLFNSLNKADLY